MFDFSNITDDWKQYYFSPLIMFFIEIIVLYIALTQRRNNTIEKLFISFILFDMLIYVSADIILGYTGSKTRTYNHYLNYANTAIAAFELILYNYYFRTILKGRRIKQILLINSLVFTLIVIAFFTTELSFITTSRFYAARIIYSLELILLIPFCCIFFVQVLNTHSRIILTQRPSFWIVTGLFFYSSISIPNELISKALTKHHLYDLFATLFFYLPLTVNFICIGKAFLCKKPLTI
jgi:hypothetical protein